MLLSCIARARTYIKMNKQSLTQPEKNSDTQEFRELSRHPGIAQCAVALFFVKTSQDIWAMSSYVRKGEKKKDVLQFPPEKQRKVVKECLTL